MEQELAVWGTSFVNNLPDSSFAYIETGGTKDSEGKTTPRSLRHLPYKDASGKVDLPHLRNAIARTSQVKGISADKAKSIQTHLRNILDKMTKTMEDEGAIITKPDVKAERVEGWSDIMDTEVQDAEDFFQFNEE